MRTLQLLTSLGNVLGGAQATLADGFVGTGGVFTRITDPSANPGST
jgi:hypothetical protein